MSDSYREPCPALGQRGLRWFRHRLVQVLTPYWTQQGIEADVAEAMVNWYAERARTYLNWSPAPTYAGRGFSSGAWVVEEAWVRDDQDKARYQCALAKEADQYPSIDAWLAAEVAGAVMGAEVEEPEAHWLLVHQGDNAAFARYKDQRRRILRKPRPCIGCGEEFSPPATTVRRCKSCCEREKAKRECR